MIFHAARFYLIFGAIVVWRIREHCFSVISNLIGGVAISQLIGLAISGLIAWCIPPISIVIGGRDDFDKRTRTGRDAADVAIRFKRAQRGCDRARGAADSGGEGTDAELHRSPMRAAGMQCGQDAAWDCGVAGHAGVPSPKQAMSVDDGVTPGSRRERRRPAPDCR